MERAKLFLDIETTGLDINKDSIISIAIQRDNEESSRVFFIEESEKELLERLSNYVPESCTIYSWRPFDIIFISQSCGFYGIKNPLLGYERSYVDLHHIVSSLKDDCRLKEISKLPEDGDISGSDVPNLYKKYRTDGEDTAKKEIIRHNKIDVKRMVEVYRKVVNPIDNFGGP